MSNKNALKLTPIVIVLLFAAVLAVGTSFLQGDATAAQRLTTVVLTEEPGEPTATPDTSTPEYAEIREVAFQVAQVYGFADEPTDEIVVETTLGVWYAIIGQSLGVEEDPLAEVYVIQFIGSGENLRSNVPFTHLTVVMNKETGYAITGTTKTFDLEAAIAENLDPVIVPPATPSGAFDFSEIEPTPIAEEEQ